MGVIGGPHQALIGQTQLNPFIATNFRMNEFTGGVMVAQIRKLDTILGAVRQSCAAGLRRRAGPAGIRFRHLPDPAGKIGTMVFVPFDSRERCDKFMAAMRAENVPVAKPGGSVVLRMPSYIEGKHRASRLATGTQSAVRPPALDRPSTLN